jgi:hypothetical protein
MRRRDQFIDQRRRRLAPLQMSLHGGNRNFRQHESGPPDLSGTCATERLTCKVYEARLEPLRLLLDVDYID